MKRTLLAALAAAVLALTACTSDDETINPQLSTEAADEMVTVSLSFSPYDVAPMTRALTSIADYCTKLDIWVYQNGEEVQAFQQESGDSEFGSLSVTLNIQKTYTLYAVAHRCNNGHATLSSAVIGFPDDKVTHSMFYTSTFTPTKNMSLNCEMQRIVAQFSFSGTDQVPDWCHTMRFTINSVYDRWHVTDGATHQLNRVSTFENFTTKQDGTVTFNIYAIVTDAQTLHDITVEAFEANATEPRESHMLKDVPLRNGYRTLATGYAFTDAPSAFSFKVADWTGEIPYNF